MNGSTLFIFADILSCYMKKTFPITEFYQDAEHEWVRLEKDPYHQLEFDTTMDAVSKAISKKATILDAGGGPGRYAIAWAKKGHLVTLLDLTPENLVLARKKIKQAKVEKNVKAIVEGTLTKLPFPDQSFDVTLCLGAALGHVQTTALRKKAVQELKRVTKKNGLIAVSVTNRSAILLDCPVLYVNEIEETKHFEELWKKGDDDRFCGKYYVHHFFPTELEELLQKEGLTVTDMVGLEGVGRVSKDALNQMAKKKIAWKNWLKAHRKLCRSTGFIHASGHILAIAKK